MNSVGYDSTWSEADGEASAMLTWESIYPAATAGKRTSNYIKVLCPFPDHADTDASCALYANGQFHCYGCGAHGSMARFLVKTGAYSDWGEALRYVQNLAGIRIDKEFEQVTHTFKPKPKPKPKPGQGKDWRAEGYELWKQAPADFAATLGETYLTSRCPVPMQVKPAGISQGFTNTGCFRFLPATYSATPSWIKRKYDSIGGLGGILIASYSYPRKHEAFELEGITVDGAKAPSDVRWRQTWGSRPSGSACLVWQFQGDVLVVCEGVLSAMSAPWCLEADTDTAWVQNVHNDIGAVVAVGSKENYKKFASNIEFWLNRTGCDRVVVCVEGGEADLGDEFVRSVSLLAEGCAIHSHLGNSKGWDCCDEMSSWQASEHNTDSQQTGRVWEQNELGGSIVTCPNGLEYLAWHFGKPNGAMVIVDASTDSFLVWLDTYLVDNSLIRSVKSHDDISCLIQINSGAMSDIGIYVKEHMDDSESRLMFCITESYDEGEKLRQECLPFGILVTVILIGNRPGGGDAEVINITEALNTEAPAKTPQVSDIAFPGDSAVV